MKRHRTPTGARTGARTGTRTTLTRCGAAALALAGTLALGACSSDSDSGSDSDSDSGSQSAPELKASGAYVPQPLMTDMAGAFLIIENSGGKPDKLTSVTSDLSDEVQLHRTVDQKMERVDTMPVPADGKLSFARGGNHLMLVDLNHKPVKGDKVSLELHFEKSDPIKLSVPVKATNHTPHQ